MQKHFHKKRDHVLKRLAEIGVPVKIVPQATFYIWLDLSSLPHPLDNGLVSEECRCSLKARIKPNDPLYRRSLRNFSRKRRSSFQVSSSKLTLPTGVTSSRPLAITSSASHLVLRCLSSIKVSRTPTGYLVCVMMLHSPPGLDAIGRVLGRVKKEGTKHIGHTYKPSRGESVVHH